MTQHCVVIDAPSSAVWDALTRPALMTRWMGDPDTGVEVETSWVVGAPIIVRGFHHAHFVNTGTVLGFEPNEMLRYSHLSSLSRLPDTPQNHSIVELRLAPVAGGTSVAVALSGFPTESIFKHLDFYWRGTLMILKRFVEQRTRPSS
jgi:uncharacterized protein YndB with AHSA1/START domain